MSNRKQRDKNRATAKALRVRLVFMDMVLVGTAAVKYDDGLMIFGGNRVSPRELYRSLNL